MTDFIREYIDYNYDSVLLPSLKDILKAYFLNNEESFNKFYKKKLPLDNLLEFIEGYIIKNNTPLEVAIIKVIET